tara:strand:+ start:233 stop:469 length:237 start_codon:yes stop_codon:yes gene_type:complete
MWVEDYNKHYNSLDNKNNVQFYVSLNNYLDFVFKSKEEDLKQVVLWKPYNNLNLINDPILEKINTYKILYNKINVKSF